MDRTVRINFYQITRKPREETPFGDALSAVLRRDLLAREYEVEPEIMFRMERARRYQGLILGEMVRRQTENLPPQAPAGQHLQPLNVDSIGHTAVFAYDPGLGVLALQMARNGVTAIRLAMYVAGLLDLNGYYTLPIPSQEAWQRLRTGRIRGFRIQVATPDNLEVVDNAQTTIRQGLVNMKRATETTYVEATFGMLRGDPDIPVRRTLPFLQWILREKEADRGGVRKLSARVIDPENGGAEWLNLLGYHMGNVTTLDLPSDNTDRNYQLRESYIRRVFDANRGHLDEMYGIQEA